MSPIEPIPAPVETVEPEPETPAHHELAKEEDSDTQTAADRDSSDGENDDNDSDELERAGARRVAWRSGVAERGAAPAGRLHRRDTPHHLKNKRVNQIDAGRARDLIAQVRDTYTTTCRRPRSYIL
ncbi:protein lap4-like [Manduca sexta]|uniref:protein lap4-like n=1 Tax=Manduca sexta TaxID=7130 RepID=UPI00188E716E|nr:protein lap4-like [Manduca sexta]